LTRKGPLSYTQKQGHNFSACRQGRKRRPQGIDARSRRSGKRFLKFGYFGDGMNSFYLHIPFCLSKCRYCGFNSVPAPGAEEIERYCRALERDIRETKLEIRNVETAYFGGGTPTLLSAGQIENLISALEKKASFEKSAEITIEANPETMTSEKLSHLRTLGFSRLSLGVQSFDDGLLKILGRPHDSGQAMAAYRLARRAGFENIGLDLIYGLPGQSMKQWERDLRRAAELGPEHISAYSLTYEPGTEFTAWREQGWIEPCGEDLEAEMFLLAHQYLPTAGYQHYEVSNFSRPGHRCRHNLNYWRCGDYLGFGAGASSHIEGRRWTNVSDWREYVIRLESGQSPIGFSEELSSGQRWFEAIFLGLRMIEGMAIEEFKSRWGQRPDEYKPEVWEKLSKEGYIISRQGRLCFTSQGLMIADLLLSNFAP